MKISFPTMMMALFATCSFGFTSAQAQDYYASGYDVATASIQDEVVTQDEIIDAQPINNGPIVPNGPSTTMMPSLTDSSGWQLETEVVFLRFHKASGTQVGDAIGGPADPDQRGLQTYQTGFEASPRISLSYVKPNNMFVKVRWFDYQHSAKVLTEGPDVADPNRFGGASIDAYSIDLVAGERFYLARGWDIEVDGGIRHYGYEEHQLDVASALDGGSHERHDVSWGLGAIVGIEARKQVSGNMSVFGRFRSAIVQGGHRFWDATPQDNMNYLNNTTSMHFELATGTEWNWLLDNGTEVFLRSFGEASQWTDVTTRLNAPGNNGALVDIGWGGFGVAFGLYR